MRRSRDLAAFVLGALCLGAILLKRQLEDVRRDVDAINLRLDDSALSARLQAAELRGERAAERGDRA